MARDIISYNRNIANRQLNISPKLHPTSALPIPKPPQGPANAVPPDPLQGRLYRHLHLGDDLQPGDIAANASGHWLYCGEQKCEPDRAMSIWIGVGTGLCSVHIGIHVQNHWIAVLFFLVQLLLPYAYLESEKRLLDGSDVLVGIAAVVSGSSCGENRCHRWFCCRWKFLDALLTAIVRSPLCALE